MMTIQKLKVIQSLCSQLNHAQMIDSTKAYEYSMSSLKYIISKNRVVKVFHNSKVSNVETCDICFITLSAMTILWKFAVFRDTLRLNRTSVNTERVASVNRIHATLLWNREDRSSALTDHICLVRRQIDERRDLKLNSEYAL